MVSSSSRELLYEQFLLNATYQDNPTLYATCGIPGAGKSYFVDEKLSAGHFPIDSYILNPDRLMVTLPEYKQDVHDIGAHTAYQKWELPVRDLAYEMADHALSKRVNIIKDMGCANPLSLDLVKRLKDDGYRVEMYYIYCDIDVAFDRINQRDFKISQQAVKNRLQLLEKMLPEYQILADSFVLLDNTNIDEAYKIAC